MKAKFYSKFLLTDRDGASEGWQYCTGHDSLDDAVACHERSREFLKRVVVDAQGGAVRMGIIKREENTVEEFENVK